MGWKNQSIITKEKERNIREWGTKKQGFRERIVYNFSRDVITKYQKLGSLKQWKFYIS